MSTKKDRSTKDSAEDAESQQMPLTPAKRFARLAGWMSFGIVCLVFFTLLKLPEDRIKAYIDGSIAVALAEKGVSFNATGGQVSFLFGLSYTMKDITLSLPPLNSPVHIDKIQVSPSLLSLLFLRYSGKIWIENGKGELNGSFSIKNSEFSVSYKIKNLELQKLGLLPLLAGFQAAATVDGAGSFSGDYANLTSLDGNAALTLTQISLEPQSIAGFSVPQLSISDAVAEVKTEKGKATIKTFRLGKPNPSKTGAIDDIQGAILGDITFAKQVELSQLNLKMHFTFSENILKSFVLLDALLGSGKQADGSYSFNLTGPMVAPMPSPGGAP
jgi:type II secretion system protein N